jgi:large subunit ribosomal protein L28
VGRHIARKNPRRFLPNLQAVRAVIDGRVRRILACTQCIKKGRLLRPAA